MTTVLPATRRPHAVAKPVKTKKYLKDHQRCEIVLRVRAGERQAHLAREFGITRAAVCYLLRHQGEILAKFAASLQEQAASATKIPGMCIAVRD
ncbi:hypothetical protein ATCC90586_009681 [Pythium insidiosum]|nr:hypothetical protein ATCC90586_009681 [Pythium insidiosum]